MQMTSYRRMSSNQLTKIVDQMSMDARATTLAGIRARHPEYGDELARWALFRILVGDALFAKAWPRAPLVDP
ncbi:hypothetical protein BH11MYX1_BH11MYX1_31790 [soil metagenome]